MWLNTDIGTRNYFQFYLMSVTGELVNFLMYRNEMYVSSIGGASRIHDTHTAKVVLMLRVTRSCIVVVVRIHRYESIGWPASKIQRYLNYICFPRTTALVFAGTLQLFWQVVVCILTMTAWRRASLDGSIALFVLNSAHAILAAIGGGSIASLWGFHTYLLYIGRGTYDWIIDRFNERDRIRAERNREVAKKRAKEQQERREKAEAEAAEEEDRQLGIRGEGMHGGVDGKGQGIGGKSGNRDIEMGVISQKHGAGAQVLDWGNTGVVP